MLAGPLSLSVLSTIVSRKRWRIRVCQFENSCTTSNCLQYFTGTSGVITFFNYDQASMFNRSTTQYLNNLNYAICIRKEAGYCSITYTNVRNGVEYRFQLNNVKSSGIRTVPQEQAGADVINCPNDYIILDGSRLCGDKLNDGLTIRNFTLNAPITVSSAGPIVIPVMTDGSLTGLGFKIFYTLNRCPTV
ncbi:unnamed protein product [Brassicogethes aeneus]|uniref:CUB domain-containing protein n=1 Tax=Brassicogethes aeneus TaxID=1431903 RepID=A0A9P0ATW6_BRAAE|nr:unnamed protein product [Brassicogethes aeneus]